MDREEIYKNLQLSHESFKKICDQTWDQYQAVIKRQEESCYLPKCFDGDDLQEDLAKFMSFEQFNRLIAFLELPSLLKLPERIGADFPDDGVEFVDGITDENSHWINWRAVPTDKFNKFISGIKFSGETITTNSWVHPKGFDKISEIIPEFPTVLAAMEASYPLKEIIWGFKLNSQTSFEKFEDAGAARDKIKAEISSDVGDSLINLKTASLWVTPKEGTIHMTHDIYDYCEDLGTYTLNVTLDIRRKIMTPSSIQDPYRDELFHRLIRDSAKEKTPNS